MKKTVSANDILVVRTVMRTIICLAAFLAISLVIIFAKPKTTSIESTDNRVPSVITTSGECLTSVAKDRTAITLRVRALDKNSAASMKTASEQMSAITAFLKTLDVQMQTTDFSSYEKTEWNQAAQKSVFLGYETNIAVEASAENMEIIETILETFAGNENVYTENLRMFTSAKTMKPAMENCLTDAVKNARERAESIAAADGKRVGKLISASYGNAGATPISPSNFMRAAKVEMAMDTAYAGGGLVAKDTDVSVSVSAIFEVK